MQAKFTEHLICGAFKMSKYEKLVHAWWFAIHYNSFCNQNMLRISRKSNNKPTLTVCHFQLGWCMGTSRGDFRLQSSQ